MLTKSDLSQIKSVVENVVDERLDVKLDQKLNPQKGLKILEKKD